MRVEAGTGLKKCRPRNFGRPLQLPRRGRRPTARRCWTPGTPRRPAAPRRPCRARDLQLAVLRNGLDHQAGGRRRRRSRRSRATARDLSSRLPSTAPRSTLLATALATRFAGGPAAASSSRSTTTTVGALDQEGVGDAGAHPAAAEDSDVLGNGGSSTCVHSSVVIFLSFFLSRNGLHPVELGLGFEKHRPAPAGRSAGAPRAGAWNTDLVMRTASGSCRPIRSASAWAASISSAGSWISVTRWTASASSAVEHAAGQQDLLGQRLPHQLLQPPAGAGRGHDAQPGFRVADPHRRGADPEVGGVGQLGAAAEAVAVQRGDHRHGQLGDPDEDAWS